MLGFKERDITTRFSTFSPLVRSSVYVFRFIRRTRKKEDWFPVNCIHPRADPDNDWRELDNEGRNRIVNKRFCLMTKATKRNKALVKLVETVDPISKLEFEVSRQFWIRYGQFTGFPKEIQSLISGDKVDPKSWVAPLQPYLDRTNLVRLKGRLKNYDPTLSNIGFRHPILLDHKNVITRLIVLERHLQANCAYEGYLLHDLRAVFWVMYGRSSIKKLISTCFKCKKGLKLINPQYSPICRSNDCKMSNALRRWG